MNNDDINKINAFFHDWKGATARFNKYTTSHNRFVLELIRSKDSDFIGVSFSFCEFISGPTHWENCELECMEWNTTDSKSGYEVKDKLAGFVVRGTDTIVIGEGD